MLVAVCGRLRGRLRAGAVGFFVEEHGQFVQVAADGARIDAATAARVHTLGQLLLPHEGGERLEAGVPVRYAGRCIGVLAVRWPAGAAWDAADVAMLLTTGAAAAGPALSGVVGRRAASMATRASDLLGVSQGIAAVRTAIDKAACAPFPVLVEGESGSGKELVARLLHRLGQRRDRAFCTVNCAALPDDLIESELFGHARGAFTGAVADKSGRFEQANGGTIFLDEIADMSLKTQAKVLRVLQEQVMERVGGTQRIKVDVRVLAATNKDLTAEIRAGRFREDLYFRLNVIPLFVPALRDRQGDIPMLAEHFIAVFAAEAGKRPKRLAPAAAARLQQYNWPGNVRELQNVIARLLIFVAGDTITAQDLAFLGRDGVPETPIERGPVVPLSEARDQFEKDYILQTLAAQQGNMSRTAEVLGVERSNLYKKLRAFGITPRGGT